MAHHIEITIKVGSEIKAITIPEEGRDVLFGTEESDNQVANRLIDWLRVSVASTIRRLFREEEVDNFLRDRFHVSD